MGPGTITPVCAPWKPGWRCGLLRLRARTLVAERRSVAIDALQGLLAQTLPPWCASRRLCNDALPARSVVASRAARRPRLNQPTHSNGLIEGFSAA